MDKVITDESGKHRLKMHVVTVDKGSNFHSLVWTVCDGSGWSDRVAITRDDLQPPTKHQRWIADLHSFDPYAGRAIIQIVEGNVPVGTLPVHYTYSWREWDLIRNREVHLLAVCKSAFDKYESSA